MNYSMIRFVLFRLVRVMGWLLVLPLIVALVYREYDSAISFLILIALFLVAGFFGSKSKPKNTVIYAKEGFTITALAWVGMSILGAVPFVITGTIPNFVDAVFFSNSSSI